MDPDGPLGLSVSQEERGAELQTLSPFDVGYRVREEARAPELGRIVGITSMISVELQKLSRVREESPGAAVHKNVWRFMKRVTEIVHKQDIVVVDPAHDLQPSPLVLWNHVVEVAPYTLAELCVPLGDLVKAIPVRHDM